MFFDVFHQIFQFPRAGTVGHPRCHSSLNGAHRCKRRQHLSHFRIVGVAAHETSHSFLLRWKHRMVFICIFMLLQLLTELPVKSFMSHPCRFWCTNLSFQGFNMMYSLVGAKRIIQHSQEYFQKCHFCSWSEQAFSDQCRTLLPLSSFQTRIYLGSCFSISNELNSIIFLLEAMKRLSHNSGCLQQFCAAMHNFCKFKHIAHQTSSMPRQHRCIFQGHVVETCHFIIHSHTKLVICNKLTNLIFVQRQ